MFDEVNNPFIIMSASRRSGKTFTLREMLYKSKAKFDAVYLISNTGTVNVDYDYIPQKNKVSTAEMNALVEQLMEKQKELKMRKRNPMSILLIFDDILNDASVAQRKGNVINDLATLGRHYGFSVIVLTQKFNALTTTTRGNADYAMMCRTRNEADIEAFVETYLTGENEGVDVIGSGKRKAFGKNLYFKIVESDFSWMVIHNTKQNSHGYKEFVYHYRAEDKKPPRFSLVRKGEPQLNGVSRVNAAYANLGYSEDRPESKKEAESRKLMPLRYTKK
jgi:hypothetical protein